MEQAASVLERGVTKWEVRVMGGGVSIQVTRRSSLISNSDKGPETVSKRSSRIHIQKTIPEI